MKIEDVKCGACNICEGTLKLIRISSSEGVEIAKEEVIIETDSFKLVYKDKEEDQIILLACEKCGRLLTRTTHLFLTQRGNDIYLKEGSLYVRTEREFTKVVKMLIFPRRGQATTAKVKTKEGWSDC